MATSVIECTQFEGVFHLSVKGTLCVERNFLKWFSADKILQTKYSYADIKMVINSDLTVPNAVLRLVFNDANKNNVLFHFGEEMTFADRSKLMNVLPKPQNSKQSLGLWDLPGFINAFCFEFRCHAEFGTEGDFKPTANVEGAIFKAYPKMAELHRKVVPQKCSELHFWLAFSESNYLMCDYSGTGLNNRYQKTLKTADRTMEVLKQTTLEETKEKNDSGVKYLDEGIRRTSMKQSCLQFEKPYKEHRGKRNKIDDIVDLLKQTDSTTTT